MSSLIEDENEGFLKLEHLTIETILIIIIFDVKRHFFIVKIIVNSKFYSKTSLKPFF